MSKALWSVTALVLVFFGAAATADAQPVAERRAPPPADEAPATEALRPAADEGLPSPPPRRRSFRERLDEPDQPLRVPGRPAPPAPPEKLDILLVQTTLSARDGEPVVLGGVVFTEKAQSRELVFVLTPHVRAGK